MLEDKNYRILVIEDDIQLTLFIKITLEREGYNVNTFYKGESGLSEALKNKYSLIILDIDLPDIDGISICKKIRENSDIPIIFFTAQNRLNEKLKAFEAGANDYIPKPVEVPELIARVKAHLRSSDTTVISMPVKECKNEYIFNDLKVDVSTRKVIRSNVDIHLSPKEYEILLFFMKNSNKILTKEQIFEEIWKMEFNNVSDKKVVDEHLNKLRNKIHLPDKPKLIHTIYGVGNILK